VVAEQNNAKNILNSVAAVIHKNKRNAAGNSETFVHPCCTHRAVWNWQYFCHR